MTQGFWDTSFGEITGKAEDAFAKTYTTIPDNTKTLANIHAFQNKSYNGIDYYELDWLLEGQFGGRHVFHKIQANHYDPQKRHRALNILKLLFNMFNIPTPQGPPAPHDLAKFLNRKAVIVIRETSPNENGKVYNWVSEVLPANQQNLVQNNAPQKSSSAQSTNTQQQTRVSSNAKMPWENEELTDDIPF